MKIDGTPFRAIWVDSLNLNDPAITSQVLGHSGFGAEEMLSLANDPAVKARADAVGLYLSSSTPAEFADFIKTEAARWQPVVKKSGLHFD